MKSLINKEWVVAILIIVVGLLLTNYPAFNLHWGIFYARDLTLLVASIHGNAINLILFFGVTNFFIPQVLRKKGVFQFSIQVVLFFIMMSLIEVFLDVVFAKHIFNFTHKISYAGGLFSVLFMHVFVIILAIAYRFSKDWFVYEKLNMQIKEAQLRSELQTLKAQINPHFLFNALNNLFSLSLSYGDAKTAEGIEKLSEMMRHVFDKGQLEYTSLRDEIKYIQDYIYMQLLRFESQIKVEFNYPDAKHLPDIPPMLLMPFIENAFKYGVSSQQYATIHINLDASLEYIHFEIRNQIFDIKESVPSHGVGLSNVRKRLELLFPKKNELLINTVNDSFVVVLKIDLK